jgi:hypothetical protein
VFKTVSITRDKKGCGEVCPEDKVEGSKRGGFSHLWGKMAWKTGVLASNQGRKRGR